MSSHLSQPLQIVLLYDNARVFDKHFRQLDALLAPLATALSAHGNWHHLQGYAAPDMVAMASDTRHFIITRKDEPMALDGFASILTNPINAAFKKDEMAAIQKHKRALLIEVHTGSLPGFGQALAGTELAGLLGDLGPQVGSETQDQHEERLLITQLLGAALVDQIMPSAVHWGQSQQVFNGATFLKLARGGFSPVLYAGPYVYGGEQMPDGQAKAGVRALGSQNILGKMVVFEPHVQDWAQSYQQMIAFITYCRSLGRILDEDECMSIGEGGPTVRPLHKNDIPQLPDGYISLELVEGDVTAREKRHVDMSQMEAAMKGKRARFAEAKLGSARKAPSRLRGGPSMGLLRWLTVPLFLYVFGVIVLEFFGFSGFGPAGSELVPMVTASEGF